MHPASSSPWSINRALDLNFLLMICLSSFDLDKNWWNQSDHPKMHEGVGYQNVLTQFLTLICPSDFRSVGPIFICWCKLQFFIVQLGPKLKTWIPHHHDHPPPTHPPPGTFNQLLGYVGSWNLVWGIINPN